jgi:hypothetical protein
MSSPFSFQEFECCRRKLAVDKSPGPSGLTSTQIKHWGPDIARMVFDLSSIMWRHHYVPQWWQDRLMTMLPKDPDHHDLNKIRPISLRGHPKDVGRYGDYPYSRNLACSWIATPQSKWFLHPAWDIHGNSASSEPP